MSDPGSSTLTFFMLGFTRYSFHIFFCALPFRFLSHARLLTFPVSSYSHPLNFPSQFLKNDPTRIIHIFLKNDPTISVPPTISVSLNYINRFFRYILHLATCYLLSFTIEPNRVNVTSNLASRDCLSPFENRHILALNIASRWRIWAQTYSCAVGGLNTRSPYCVRSIGLFYDSNVRARVERIERSLAMFTANDG